MTSTKVNDNDLFDSIIFRHQTKEPHQENDGEAIDDIFSSIPDPRPSSTRNLTTSQRAIFYPDTNLPHLSPKVIANFFIHEEVSSTQKKTSDLDDVTSHVLIDGSVHARVQCPKALKNPQLSLQITDVDNIGGFNDDDPSASFIYNQEFVTSNEDENNRNQSKILAVPTWSLDKCKVASYQRSVTKKLMPLLLQTKIVRTGPDLKTCTIAVQLRTNVKNKGTLKNLTVVMAIPPTILGSTIKIMSEEKYGTYDDLKRVIKWNKRELVGGQSLMLLAKAELTDSTALLNDELPKIPILVRCSSSEDTVSNIHVDAKPIDGYPMKLTVKKIRSFRLLHRLPS